MDRQPITAADLETVTEQLQRTPQGIVGVAARCPAGHPCVVATHPLRREGSRIIPFPTLYWLTCPALVRDVSRLEAAGLIHDLDARLAADEAFAQAVEADHRAYVDERWTLLDPAERAAVEAAGLAESFAQRGIGGVSYWRSVKCLHMHLAHHLAARNVIGALLVETHGLHACR